MIEEKKYLWTSADTREATGGESPGDWESYDISIDSRSVKNGDLFVALKGENFDGHDYVNDAINNGSPAVMVERLPEGFSKYSPHIVVSDCQKALEGMATFNRKRIETKIVAVTGSVGKTSVKNAISLVLNDQGKTHSTKGNFNNHIGLPLTMARMPIDSKYAVIEMGMNHSGELSRLTNLLKPHIAVVTNVEAVHMEFFDSIEGIVDAKSEIFEGVVSGGSAVLPFDSPHFQRLKNAALAKGISNIITFGASEGADCRITMQEGQEISAEIQGEPINYSFPLSGKHQAMNSLAVLAATKAVGGGVKEAAKSLSKLEATEGRGKLYDINLGNSITLVDDSYNASPASMRAAFSVLGDLKTRKGGRAVAVLGDMLELGNETVGFHKSLKEDIIKNKVDQVFTAGDLMANLYDDLPEEIRGKSCKSALDLLPVLKDKVMDNDIVLVKGSHGSQMWKLVEKLREEAC